MPAMTSEKIVSLLKDFIASRQNEELVCDSATQHAWLNDYGIPVEEHQLYFNRANPPEINENHFLDYMSEWRNDFDDFNGSEVGFFYEYEIPLSHWEEYRWRAGESGRTGSNSGTVCRRRQTSATCY